MQVLLKNWRNCKPKSYSHTTYFINIVIVIFSFKKLSEFGIYDYKNNQAMFYHSLDILQNYVHLNNKMNNFSSTSMDTKLRMKDLVVGYILLSFGLVISIISLIIEILTFMRIFYGTENYSG
jgi:hypothetical protein